LINNKRFKLLLIAGYFPPVRISSGSIRSWNLAKELISLGWAVTVVTPKISIWRETNLDDVEYTKLLIEKYGIKVIYTGHCLKCLAPARYKITGGTISNVFGGVLRSISRKLSIENWAGWIPSALYACRKITSTDVDIIVSSGAPYSGFVISHLLSKKIRKPFIIDYRDLWTDSPFVPISKNWIKNIEKKIIENCSAVTVVSPGFKEVLSKKYNNDHKIFTITNGYNSEELDNINIKMISNISIIYSGSLLPPKRTLAPLLEALKKLKSTTYNADWKFHYFGPNSEFAYSEIEKYDLLDKSIIHGNLPRREILPILKGASLNVVITSNDPCSSLKEKAVIPGKIFELIGLNANILLISPQGSSIEDISSNLGLKTFKPDEIEDIFHFIIELMNGKLINLKNKEQYAWRNLSKTFDALLREKILENE